MEQVPTLLWLEAAEHQMSAIKLLAPQMKSREAFQLSDNGKIKYTSCVFR